MTGKSHSDDPPGGGVSRRELIGRIIKGSAFAVPVIASFDMASLGVSSAYANNANQYPNTPPSFSSANTATFTVGTAGYFTILTPGTPSITLTQTGTLPKGVQFTQDLYNYDEQNNAGGALSGTPDAGTAGSYPLKFTASNSYPPDATQAFTLLVTQGPVFTSADAVSFNQGEAASFTVTTSGFPGAVISASSLPPGLILTPNQGAGSAVLSGTPTFGGTYPLAFTAFNGVGAAIVQSFTITVVPSSVFTVSDVKTSSSTAFTCVVTVPGPGLVTATLSAPGKHGSRVTIATAKNTFSFPGTVELKTAPNKAGRTLATAKHRKSEVLWLVVTFTPTGGAAAVHTVKGLHLK